MHSSNQQPYDPEHYKQWLPPLFSRSTPLYVYLLITFFRRKWSSLDISIAILWEDFDFISSSSEYLGFPSLFSVWQDENLPFSCGLAQKIS